jgi:hypothetical protein
MFVQIYEFYLMTQSFFKIDLDPDFETPRSKAGLKRNSLCCVWQVSEAKRMAGVRIVTPDWLWACAERWEKVDERLYPLGQSVCSRVVDPH